jgi:hypothetical protein
MPHQGKVPLSPLKRPLVGSYKVLRIDMRDEGKSIIKKYIQTLRSAEDLRKDDVISKLKHIYSGQGVHGLFSEIKICSQLFHVPCWIIYILFFLPSACCFSHIAYNSYLLIIPIELCGRFLADHSGAFSWAAERFLYGLRFQLQTQAVSWGLPQTC